MRYDRSFNAVNIRDYPSDRRPLLSIRFHFLFILFFLLLPDIPSAAGQSNAIREVYTASQLIPRGTPLQEVQHLLKTKFVLRGDMTGEPLEKRKQLSGLFATTELRPGELIYMSSVTASPNRDLGDILPPRHTPYAVFLPRNAVAELTLCGAYDYLRVVDRDGNVLSERSRVIGKSLESQEVIVTLAVPDSEIERLSNVSTIHCTTTDKYYE